MKCDGTRAETRFRLSAKRTNSFNSAGASVQSTTGSRRVRISRSKAGYTMFRSSVKSTGHPLHSPVSPSLPLPCTTVCHHISSELYLLSHAESVRFLYALYLHVSHDQLFSTTLPDWSLSWRNIVFSLKQELNFNPLNPELNPICYLLALLAHHFLHVSRIRVKSLTFRLLMSYIYICIYIYIYIYIYMEHPFLMFLDLTQRRTTVGRTPLDE